jgi:putative transposase
MSYFSKNRHKFYLKCHLIFVCKYRKQLLLSDIRDCVISVFKEVESKCDFDIEIMETDKDHIHLLINYPPNITVTSIVRILKQVSTNRLWKEFQPMLRKHFWKEHSFWSDGYLYALLVKQIQILLESTLRIKVNAIHPIN